MAMKEFQRVGNDTQKKTKKKGQKAGKTHFVFGVIINEKAEELIDIIWRIEKCFNGRRKKENKKEKCQNEFGRFWSENEEKLVE
jgi:hypothetical protein